LTLTIIAIALASFSFGVALCNVVYIFFSPYSPYSKCNDRNRKASGTDKQGEDGNDL